MKIVGMFGRVKLGVDRKEDVGYGGLVVGSAYQLHVLGGKAYERFEAEPWVGKVVNIGTLSGVSL